MTSLLIGVALKRLKWLASKPYVGVVVELAGLVGGAEHNGKRAAPLRYRSGARRGGYAALAPGCVRGVCMGAQGA